MPRINLLPWREELRKEQLQVFGVTSGVVAAVAALIVFIAMNIVEGDIRHQESRNQYLEAQIAILDRQIAEIRELESTKASLLARMQVIEELQSSRPEIVHLFDQLVRTLPDGVHLTAVSQTDANLEIHGIAQSSARVSAYMRSIEASDYLSIGRLDIIQAVQHQQQRAREFVLHASQSSPRKEGEEE